MDAKDVEQVITHAPEADIIISHMDNVAHASLSRTSLSEQLESQNLLSRGRSLPMVKLCRFKTQFASLLVK